MDTNTIVTARVFSSTDRFDLFIRFPEASIQVILPLAMRQLTAFILSRTSLKMLVSPLPRLLMHDMLTGRSVTGILHFVNQTPFEWYAKKQSTVETATYGSEMALSPVSRVESRPCRGLPRKAHDNYACAHCKDGNSTAFLL